MTDEEIKITLSNFNGKQTLRNKALFALGVATGFRVKELLSLKVKDIYNIQNRQLLPYISVQKKNMKKCNSRPPVKYSEAINDYMIKYIQSRPELDEDSYLFASTRITTDENGITMLRPILVRSAIRIIKNAYEDSGLNDLNLGSHSMRKSFAARIYEASGHDLLKTQKAMGHKNMDSTTKYLVTCDSEISGMTSGIKFL